MTAIGVRQLALVVAVASIVMLTNLGGPRLWDRDEPRNAGCAREMLERGDIVVPTFNATLRTHKPVLLYWLIMSAYSVFGIDEFSARLPSALCAVGTCVATYIMGRRLFPAAAATIAGVALATSVMFVVAGRAATPDSVLIFCTAAAIAVYVSGTFLPLQEGAESSARSDTFGLHLRTEGHYFPQQWKWVVSLYATMGLAVLAKGPVGLVLPTAVIGMFLLIMRLPAAETPATGWFGRVRSIVRPFAPLHFLRTCWYMRPLTALAVAGAVALPWYIAVGIQTEGEFLRGFFYEHNLERATRAMEGHDGGPLFYPVAILIGFFPWSIFAIPVAWDTVARLRRRDAGWPALVLCLCWVGVYVGLFSLARTKLPSYVTPCYPAMALLVGSFVDRWRRGEVTTPAWLPRIGFGLLSLAGVAMLIALPIIARRQLPGEEWLGVFGLIPLAVGVIGILADRFERRRQAVWVMGCGSAALVTLIFAVGAQRADLHQQNDQMLQAIFAESPNPKLASYRTLEPSWVFYGKKPIVELPAFEGPRPTSPADLIAAGQSQAIEFLQSAPDAYLITTGRRLAELQPHLPDDVEVVSDTPLFLKKDRLVALRRKTDSRTAERAENSQVPLR